MARRRKDGLFDILTDLPWWVSVGLAALSYVAMKDWFPAFWADNMLLAGITRGLHSNAGLFASFFLVPAAVSFFGSIKRRRLIDCQSGLESIRAMSWREFEMLCGEAFRRKGYRVVENGLGGADGGVDLIVRKNGETGLVQCKRWRNSKVGIKEIREIYGIVAAEHADRGIFITSATYTNAAANFAEGKPLDLIDGPALLDFVREVQNQHPCKVADEPSAPMQTEAATPASHPVCPKCGNSMVLRTAQRGRNAGSQFWGCSNFPKCRGVLASS